MNERIIQFSMILKDTSCRWGKNSNSTANDEQLQIHSPVYGLPTVTHDGCKMNKRGVIWQHF